jgi:hypothetical protein
MTDWVNAELDRRGTNSARWFSAWLDEIKWEPDGEASDSLIAFLAVERAIKHADEEGDIEPLRKDLWHLTGHDLARFLKRPKRKRGEKFSKDDGYDRVKKAATDVLFIRMLWRREFPSHYKRPKGDLVKAERIAADRNKVSVAAIESKLKNPRRMTS